MSAETVSAGPASVRSGAAPTVPTDPIIRTRRRRQAVAMKLVSIDTQFGGTIVDILTYRTAPTGLVEVTAVLDCPNAWYSRTYPVVLDANVVRLLLTVQSVDAGTSRRLSVPSSIVRTS